MLPPYSEAVEAPFYLFPLLGLENVFWPHVATQDAHDCHLVRYLTSILPKSKGRPSFAFLGAEDRLQCKVGSGIAKKSRDIAISTRIDSIGSRSQRSPFCSLYRT